MIGTAWALACLIALAEKTAAGPARFEKCLTLSLRVSDTQGSEWPAAALRIANGCREAAGVLGEPIETRIVGKEDRWFKWYNEGSFSQLMIFPKNSPWLPQTDAWLTVKGDPAFVIVEPGRTVEVPITGPPRTTVRLPPGQYEAYFVTRVAPRDSVRRTCKAIQLARDVAGHNQNGDAQPFDLGLEIESVATAKVSFRVR